MSKYSQKNSYSFKIKCIYLLFAWILIENTLLLYYYIHLITFWTPVKDYILHKTGDSDALEGWSGRLSLHNLNMLKIEL